MNNKPTVEAPTNNENMRGDINSVADRARLAIKQHYGDSEKYIPVLIAMMDGIWAASSYEKQIAVLAEYVEFQKYAPV
jgi:hypothetical protein